MARIRTVKPEFFRHRRLFLAEQESGLPLRVAFAGLWTVADRAGRFRWEPDELKLDCLPYDNVDFSRVLDALTTRGFLVKYVSQGREYGAIPGFERHQIINNREAKSNLPPPPECIENPTELTRAARVADASSTPLVQDQGEGKGREGKGTEVLSPRLSAGTSQGAADDPARDVVKAFMAARNERWPDAMPANNFLTQVEHARAMLIEPGATPELVCELVKAAVAKWRDPKAPGGVGAFRQSIANQIAQHVRATAQTDRRAASQQTHAPNVAFIDHNARLRARLESYKADGKWPYGDPEPTSRYCQIDPRLMLEVMGEEFMRKHHAPPTVYPQAPAVSAAH